MKREIALSILENVSSRGLYSAIIYYVSPIGNKVEERHIYSDSSMECLEWLDSVEKHHNSETFPAYITYWNGGIRHSKANIGNYFED